MVTAETTPAPKILSKLRDSELPTLVPTQSAPATARGQRIALSILLFASFLAAAYVASSLWVGLAFGTVTAFAMQQPYRALCHRLGGSPRHAHIAAALVTLATGAVCVGFGLLAIYVMTDELLTLVGYLQTHVGSGSLADIIGPRAARMVAKIGLNPDEVVRAAQMELQKLSSYATGAAGAILQTTSTAVLGLIMALFTMYYVLVEWPKLACRVERVLPLDPLHTRALILEVRDVGRSAFIGTLATALIQGALAGIGYAALGVPRPATWGLMTALASLIPVVGTALIWVPVAGYLAMIGHPVRGVILVAWGLLVVTSLADYVIRPRIVGGAGHGHPLLMLIAILGGIDVFGFAGLVVGPIFMSLFLAVLRLHEALEPALPVAAPVTPAAPKVEPQPSSSTGGGASSGSGRDLPPMSTLGHRGS